MKEKEKKYKIIFKYNILHNETFSLNVLLFPFLFEISSAKLFRAW
jgi:hypothetical protein